MSQPYQTRQPVQQVAYQPRAQYQSAPQYQPRQQVSGGRDPGGSLTGQQAAQIKANWMAQRGATGHPRMDLNKRIAGGYGMEGTGWHSSNGQNVRTCTPRRGGMQLIGDATAKGRRGYHRVRIWR